MDPRLLESLQVSTDTIADSTSFFESYALLCEQDLESALESDEHRWQLLSEAACARQEAAQFALLLDENWGRELLRRAGEGYLAAGLPYGFFLQLAASETMDPRWIMQGPARWLIEVVYGPTTGRGQVPGVDEEHRPPLLDAALATPTQQAYLLLVTASHPQVASEYQDMLDQLVDRPEARSAVPIGPQSMPLSFYWEIAQLFVRIHRRDERARDRLIGELAELARLQGRALRQAQLNQYQWRLLAAPVNMVDLDLAGITAAAIRAVRLANLPATLELDHPRFRDLSDLGLLSIAAGIDLSGPSHRRGGG